MGELDDAVEAPVGGKHALEQDEMEHLGRKVPRDASRLRGICVAYDSEGQQEGDGREEGQRSVVADEEVSQIASQSSEADEDASSSVVLWLGTEESSYASESHTGMVRVETIVTDLGSCQLCLYLLPSSRSNGTNRCR